MKPRNPLIITGMHRSGTSLFASYLELCGLDIGNEHVPKEIDNPKGYFENIDFVKLHKKVLEKNAANLYLPGEIKFDGQDKKMLKVLIDKYKKDEVWGWKDPRTVIFLDEYVKMLDRSGYIFIFRYPDLVIDSLIRRKTERITKIYPLISAQSWLWYNRKILDFVGEHPSRSLIIQLDDFIEYPEGTIKAINRKFRSSLEAKDLSLVYEERLLKTKKEFGLRTNLTLKLYIDQINKVYKQLLNHKVKLT